MKHKSEDQIKKATNPSILTECEAIVMEELFDHWVDEIKDARIMIVLLEEFFFADNPAEIVEITLRQTIDEHITDTSLTPIVMDMLKGTQMRIAESAIGNFDDLADSFLAEKVAASEFINYYKEDEQQEKERRKGAKYRKPK